jgi:hypothetical protein
MENNEKIGIYDNLVENEDADFKSDDDNNNQPIKGVDDYLKVNARSLIIDSDRESIDRFHNGDTNFSN